MTGIAAHSKTESWLTLTGQTAHLGADYSRAFTLGQNVAGAYQKKGEKIDRPRKRPDSWQGTFGLPFTNTL